MMAVNIMQYIRICTIAKTIASYNIIEKLHSYIYICVYEIAIYCNSWISCIIYEVLCYYIKELLDVSCT